MGRPSSGIKKQMFTTYVETSLLAHFKEAAYRKTKSFKGISVCVEEAMKDWLKKN